MKKLLATDGVKETDEKVEMNTVCVLEVHRLYSITSAIISEDFAIGGYYHQICQGAWLRGVFLVNPQKRFKGLVKRIDLIKWAHLKLFRGKGSREITILEFFRFVDAKKARDNTHIASKVLSIKENGTFQSTLYNILDHEEGVLSILNSQKLKREGLYGS